MNKTKSTSGITESASVSKATGVIVGIDIGGTFTDTVVLNENGEVFTYKSFSTPERLLDGFLNNVRLASEIDGLDIRQFLQGVSRIAHGTTVATNAFIERRGGKVGLLTTRGFEDTLVAQRMMGMTAGLSPSEMRDYAKREIPSKLVEHDLIFGIRERTDYAGREVAPLFEEDVVAAVNEMRQRGVNAIAICFLWSIRDSEHELRAAEIVKDLTNDIHVSMSHEIAPRIGEYERMATTVANSYLAPIVSAYTSKLRENLAAEAQEDPPPVFLLDSIGGVMDPAEAAREPVRMLLSGPSGGMTACEDMAKLLGHPNVITFDMGGTSCDVGLMVDGEVIKRSDITISKYHLILPTIDIHVIGSGGGSIAKVVSNKYLQVGPESAGSIPGPACYGREGKLPTVTDADVILGILNPANFLGGRVELDVDAAREAIREHVADPLGISIEEAAAGIKRIVDSQMHDLLRTVTIDRGRDPREFVLYAYGGAGPSHAPSFALELVPEVVIPSTHSVHSALGAVASDAHAIVSMSELFVIHDDGNDEECRQTAEKLAEIFSQLVTKARKKLTTQGIAKTQQSFDGIVYVRYHRQPKELSVKLDSLELTADVIRKTIRQFEINYAQSYGEESIPTGVGIELVGFAVEAKGLLPHPAFRPQQAPDDHKLKPKEQRRAYDATIRAFVSTAIYQGEDLAPGDKVHGPAILEYVDTTVNIGSRQIAVKDEYKNIHITPDEKS